MVIRTLLKRNTYYDSIALMMAAQAVREQVEIDDVGVVMATEANRALLEQVGLLPAPFASTFSGQETLPGPDDLLIVVRAQDEARAQAALILAEQQLASRAQKDTQAGVSAPPARSSTRRKPASGCPPWPSLRVRFSPTPRPAARSKAWPADKQPRGHCKTVELPSPCLMLVTDRHRCGPAGLSATVAAAVAAGIDALQLREKDLEAEDLYRLAVELRARTAGRCAFIVNGRLDIAMAADADGVHLPERGLPLEAVRRICPPRFLAGRSVHSPEGAAAAQAAGASYIQLGTIFSTDSKPGLEPAGPALVRVACAGLEIPCLAVGGVDAGNAGQVLAAGASGVAVVSAILQAEDVAAAVRTLRRALIDSGARSPA